MFPRHPLWVLLLSMAGTAAAHHGISNWDLNRDVSITGTLAAIDLVNPHAWIHVDVRGADGRTTRWKCEMRSASALRRSGWTKEMFRVGATITVTGSPERRKPDQCYLSTILFADGSSMDRYGQRQLAVAQAVAPAARRPRTADGRPDLSGTWAAEQRVMSDPRGLLGTLVLLSEARRVGPATQPSGPAFPGARGSPASLASDPIRAAWDRPIPVRLTAKAQQALRDFDPASTDNPRLRCEPTSILFDWTFDSVVNQIQQSPTRITLRYGHMDLERVIHLDRKAPPADVKPSRAGYSVGSWDGDTLVVTTTAFAPGVLNADSRILHGTQLRIVERFALDPSGTRLTRQYVAEDPEYFADRWQGADEVLPADVPYEPYQCRDLGGAPAGR